MKKIDNKDIIIKNQIIEEEEKESTDLIVGSHNYGQIYAILAPMAGYTDLPFRRICEEFGAKITVTEMINAKALCYGDEKTKKMLDTTGQKNDVIVQIFGSEVKYMVEATKYLNSLGRFSEININMGCPAPKIVKNGDGSALMKNPPLAGEIVEEMKKVSKLPITVKIRKGFNDNEVVGPEFAKYMMMCGADAVTVHARTVKQYYSGTSDRDITRYIKKLLEGIPVIGNGDVTTPEELEQLKKYTKCDAVAIARGALGNPFIFKQINDYFETGKYEKVKDYQKIETALKHYEMAIDYFGEDVAVREMRKQLNCYLKGIKNSCAIKNSINTEVDSKVVIKTLKDFSNLLRINDL